MTADVQALRTHNAELMNAFVQQERLADHLRKQLATAEALVPQHTSDCISELPLTALPVALCGKLGGGSGCNTGRSAESGSTCSGSSSTISSSRGSSDVALLFERGGWAE